MKLPLEVALVQSVVSQVPLSWFAMVSKTPTRCEVCPQLPVELVQMSWLPVISVQESMLPPQAKKEQESLLLKPPKRKLPPRSRTRLTSWFSPEATSCQIQGSSTKRAVER